MSLYELIRESAGSEMIRQAERMAIYDAVAEYLGEGKTSPALDLAMQFENYPYAFTHMIPFTLEDVADIHDDEIKNLPFIYIIMLQSLAWDDDAAALINEKILAQAQGDWILPLSEGISNKNAFNHVYNKWLAENGWIESFNV
jgi:hypothetical protein